jgi:anti-sigma B factor antagonist
MSVEIEHAEGADIVRVTGSIDAKTAPAVGTGLAPALDGKTDLILDLSGVDYVSSAGLRLLLVAYRKLHGESRRLVLSGVKSDIVQVMSHTGFVDFFVFAPDAETALGTLSGSAPA